MLHQVLSFGMF